MDDLLGRDLLYSLRRLKRQPGVTATVVVSLGVCVGVAASLLVAYKAFWLTPWPVQDARSVVVGSAAVSPAEWQQWRREASCFEELGATRAGRRASLNGRSVSVEFVSANYFALLGVGMKGVGLSDAADLRREGTPRAIITERIAERALDATPTAAIGKEVLIDGRRYDVAGVVGTFRGVPRERDAWLPLSETTAPDGDNALVSLVGRLAKTCSLGDAEAELRMLRARDSTPDSRREAIALGTTDLRSRVPASLRARLGLDVLVLAVVGFITFVGASNVGALLLASAVARRGEMTIRLAVGASRARLIRQLSIESLLLGLGATALAFVIARWLPLWLFQGLPLPWYVTMRVDWQMFGWIAGLGVAAAIGFGLSPALECARVSLRGVGGSRRSLPTVPSYQTIASMSALVVAGLLLHGTAKFYSRSLHGTLRELAVVRVAAGSDGEPQRGTVSALAASLEERLGGGNVAAADADPADASGVVRVTANYFRLLHIVPLSGRLLDESDIPEQTTVVNAAFAAAGWPGESPLGKTLASAQAGIVGHLGATLECRMCEVVGVVQDDDLSAPDALHWRLYQHARSDTLQVVIVKSHVDVTAPVAQALTRIDPGARATIVPGSAWVTRRMMWALLGIRLASVLGTMALLLGTVGQFSVSSYVVRQQSRDIGVRIALGATTAGVIRGTFGQAIGAVARGILFGLCASGGAATIMDRAGWLQGVRALDPVTFGSVLVCILVTTTGGLLVPVRRALAVDPARVLREE